MSISDVYVSFKGIHPDTRSPQQAPVFFQSSRVSSREQQLMDQSWLQVPWENKDAKKVYSFQLWHGYREVNSEVKMRRVLLLMNTKSIKAAF